MGPVLLREVPAEGGGYPVRQELPGGLRVLRVAPEAFVDFLKGQGGAIKTYDVKDALPDDTVLVKQRTNECGEVELLLSSKEWGTETDWAFPEVDSPCVTIYYVEAIGRPAAGAAGGEGIPTANQGQG